MVNVECDFLKMLGTAHFTHKDVFLLTMHNPTFLDGIYAEWGKFSTTGNPKDCSVPSHIIESWVRCYDAGVQAFKYLSHPSLSDIRLKKVLLEKAKLIKIAKPFMENLYKFVKGSGFVVVLTDEKGYIIQAFSDDDTLRNSITQNFFQGASWREEMVGTNAIGTALVIGGPIQISGPEHYCQQHHCLTCSAAPIYNAEGEIIGILDISGASQASHLHTLGMVVAAAEAIMAQINIQRKNSELALVNNRLTSFFNAVSDGILIIDKMSVIIQVNPAAKDIFGKSEQDLLGKSLAQLVEGRSFSTGKIAAANEPYTDLEITVDKKGELSRCLASCEPLYDEYEVIVGNIILLRPIKRVQNLVNHYNGNYATFQFGDIVGESDSMKVAIRMANQAAVTSSNVLLQGESGTGKEVFVQAIHNRSSRKNGPFIALNCGAIPRELINSELFGYDDGAFTGAKRGGKPGKFELAFGGTLFLDEIGDMPLEQQTALLRVIQERKITRIGSGKMIPINVRLICATNKNLAKEVEKGAFRQDLFYRLNVLSIVIPPLRHHLEDLPLLFKYFLEKLGRDWNSNFFVEPGVIEYLMQYSWPGNVRELQNVIERAANLAENEIISVRNLPEKIYTPSLQVVSPSSKLVSTVKNREQRKQMAQDAEKDRIVHLLNISGGNVSQVAKILDVSRKTLYNKIHLYQIIN